jgi:hypothetical protein
MTRTLFFALVAVTNLIGAAPALSQPLWRGASYGMTVEAFQARYPDAKEVIRRPTSASLRIVDSTMGEIPADITFVFNEGRLSSLGYRLKLQSSSQVALERWDQVLRGFQEWHKPTSVQNSRRAIGQEVIESWETNMRTAVELTLVKDFAPETYEISGSVQVAPWELMAREKLAQLAAIDARNEKLLVVWKGRTVTDYVKEFGPPDTVTKIENAESLYVWNGASLNCKTTLFVNRSAKILDRIVTGCSR